MAINIAKLKTVANFAAEQGTTPNYVYQLFNPENNRRAALELRKGHELVIIDGIKFVKPLPKPKKAKDVH